MPAGAAIDKTKAPAVGVGEVDFPASRAFSIVGVNLATEKWSRREYLRFVVQHPTAGYEIERRYSDFKWLRSVLARQFPGVMMPALPPATNLLFQDDEFLPKRISALTDFLNRVSNKQHFHSTPAYELFVSPPSGEAFRKARKTVEKELDESPEKVLDNLRTHFAAIDDDELPKNHIDYFSDMRETASRSTALLRAMLRHVEAFRKAAEEQAALVVSMAEILDKLREVELLWKSTRYETTTNSKADTRRNIPSTSAAGKPKRGSSPADVVAAASDDQTSTSSPDPLVVSASTSTSDAGSGGSSDSDAITVGGEIAREPFTSASAAPASPPIVATPGAAPPSVTPGEQRSVTPGENGDIAAGRKCETDNESTATSTSNGHTLRPQPQPLRSQSSSSSSGSSHLSSSSSYLPLETLFASLKKSKADELFNFEYLRDMVAFRHGEMEILLEALELRDAHAKRAVQAVDAINRAKANQRAFQAVDATNRAKANQARKGVDAINRATTNQDTSGERIKIDLSEYVSKLLNAQFKISKRRIEEFSRQCIINLAIGQKRLCDEQCAASENMIRFLEGVSLPTLSGGSAAPPADSAGCRSTARRTKMKAKMLGDDEEGPIAIARNRKYSSSVDVDVCLP